MRENALRAIADGAAVGGTIERAPPTSFVKVLRRVTAAPSPFDLADDAAYRVWRARKLADAPRTADDLLVELRDPRVPSAAERAALLERCARFDMALYRSPVRDADPSIPRRLGRAVGLARLDANWLADEDGVSRIEAAAGAADGPAAPPRADFIPYTTRAIGWHTDGYYHPAARRIRAMILHCVRPAARGGENRLLDHELAYIALRDANADWVRALMAPDAMTIPAREAEDGSSRPAQSGPVFSVDPADGRLHMRYTARTRSIVWKPDATTTGAVAALSRLLAAPGPGVVHLRLEPGMGIVANNVLHDRSAFDDDAAAPRLLFRARYLDRIADPDAGLGADRTVDPGTDGVPRVAPMGAHGDRPWRTG